MDSIPILVARDRSPTESLWGSLKVGRLYGKKFATQRQAMDEVIDWLTFYNHRRLHSTLEYVSPMRFEANWHASQSKKAAYRVAMDCVDQGQAQASALTHSCGRLRFEDTGP